MFQSGLFKKRKATGSIIGGAFLVLIILAGYEFYVLNNRAQNDYQLTLNEMRNFDIDKNQEDLKVPHIEKFGDIDINDEDDTVTFSGSGTIRIHIRNDGPQLISLEYIGLLIGGEEPDNTECYQQTDLKISPSTVEQLDIVFTDEYHSHTITQLQIVTNRGNVFPIEYPQDQEDYPYYTILEGAISKVIGRVVPEYDSFYWSKRALTQIEEPFDWSNNWAVEYDKDSWYIFKINVVHYGADSLTLGDNTALYFNDLMGPDDVQYYIVDYDKTTGQISQHTGVTLPYFNPDDPEVVTLYFATNVEGSDPIWISDNAKCPFKKEAKYQIVLGIYESIPDYSQAFSLIAIEVS